MPVQLEEGLNILTVIHVEITSSLNFGHTSSETIQKVISRIYQLDGRIAILHE